MIRLSRIWKLYLVYTIVLIAGMVLAGFVLEAELKKRLKGHLEEDVVTLTEVIAKVLPDTEDSSLLDSFCQDYQKTAGVRVTIIRRDGQVIGESDRKAIRVKNHLDRLEVRRAVTDGMGTAVRYSDTLNIDMMYVALFLEEKRKILRLAMPMTKVRTFENQMMIIISLALYLIPVVAMIIAFLFAKYRAHEGNRVSQASGNRRQ